VPGANVTDCRGVEGYERLVADVWPWVDAALYAFVPFFVILALNSLIIRHLMVARRFRGHQLSISHPTTSDHELQKTKARIKASAGPDAVTKCGRHTSRVDRGLG